MKEIGRIKTISSETKLGIEDSYFIVSQNGCELFRYRLTDLWDALRDHLSEQNEEEFIRRKLEAKAAKQAQLLFLEAYMYGVQERER